jgi:glycine cleavage system transcriptional repressor
MKSHAIVTVIGSDRLGIVDDLTTAILEKHCNIEESRMTVLGGEFAVILLLSGEEQDIDSLMSAAADLEQQLGLSMTIKQTVAPKEHPEMRPYTIEVVSLDTPGIVHSITSLLRQYNINIEDLETDTTAAPWTGAPMFVMRGRISVPASVVLTELREQLELLEAEQNLDVKLNPISVTPLEF